MKNLAHSNFNRLRIAVNRGGKDSLPCGAADTRLCTLLYCARDCRSEFTGKEP